MEAIQLSGLQQATLGKIIQEQSWAEAHEFSLHMREASPDHVEFHTLHRDMAISARDERLEVADPEVKSEFDRYMQLRFAGQRDDKARLIAIAERIEVLLRDLAEHREARAENWRNYRSRPAHAFDVLWQQELRKLQLEQFYLTATLEADPLLWQETIV